MAKAFEELELRDDFMFGVVMRNPKLCKPFLERILGEKISRIEYPESQKTIDVSPGARGVRLDVYVEDGKGTVYDIDMQNKTSDTEKNLPKRTRYYGAMMDLNTSEKSMDYQNLKRSLVIFVCTFDQFKKGRHIYTFENRCIQDPNLKLGDDTTKIILNTKGTMDDVSPELKKVLDYIDGQEPTDAFTKKLDAEVQSVRKNEKWRVDYLKLELNYQDKFREGKQEGIKEGRKEGRLENLFNNISTLMESMKWSVEQAMEALKVSEDDRKELLKRF